MAEDELFTWCRDVLCKGLRGCICGGGYETLGVSVGDDDGWEGGGSGGLVCFRIVSVLSSRFFYDVMMSKQLSKLRCWSR